MIADYRSADSRLSFRGCRSAFGPPPREQHTSDERGRREVAWDRRRHASRDTRDLRSDDRHRPAAERAQAAGVDKVPGQADRREADQRNRDVERNVEHLLAAPTNPPDAAERPDDELRRGREEPGAAGIRVGGAGASRKRGRADLRGSSENPRLQRRLAAKVGQVAVDAQEHFLGEMLARVASGTARAMGV